MVENKKYQGVRSFVSPKIEIRESQVDGTGGFAISDINKGEIVFIKGGHILTRDTMFSYKEIDGYWPIDDNYVLAARNAEEFDYIKFFINHSCNPNCGIRGEITGVAMRKIKKGEEVTFDYAMIDNEDSRFKCNCGSLKCRGVVTGRDWMIPELQVRYKGYFARYLEDKMK